MDPIRPNQNQRREGPKGLMGGRVIHMGRFLGIRLGLDPSWFFLFVFVTYSVGNSFGREHPDWSGALVWGSAIGGSLTFFFSILLHELGHSVTAISLGISVRSITLFLFGGVAELESEARRPRDEFLIAIAGPAVSGLVCLLFSVVCLWSPADGPLGVVSLWLALLNGGVTVFNLLPGFPLDGGRVLRSFLWATLGSQERATRWAGRVGVLLGNLLMALGLVIAIVGQDWVYGLFLGFMGWFLTRSARATVLQSILSGRLRSLTVRDAADLSAPRVDAWDTLEDVVNKAPQATEGGVLVLSEGEPVGVLGPEEIAHTAPKKYAFVPARTSMTALDGLGRVSPEASLYVALRAMDRDRVSQLLVEAGGEILGVLSRSALAKAVRAG
jgi:Zn-dependent protease/CBS domain-containing protein